jgi:hypothetical protein
MRTIATMGLVALLGLGLAAGAADAKTRRRATSDSGAPDATLRIEQKSVALGIGYQWGSGTLLFRGRTYPFKIDGLSVNAVGASKSEAIGYVYNLKSVNDFEGTYTAIEAGGAAGGGKGITSMKNGSGVRITLHTTSQGLEAKAAPEGVKITLQ